MNETGKKLAAVGIIGGLAYLGARALGGPKEPPGFYASRGRSSVGFVMKLTQGGIDVGTTPAPGVETTALVHVANASKLGVTPVAVPVTIRLAPVWGSTTIAVADQAITVPAAGTSDVSFKFTFPAASEGLTGSVTCKALTPAGAVVATLPLAVTIISPVTYAASGALYVFAGGILVPANQTLQVGMNYLASWSVNNLSKYQFTGINAYADLSVMTLVTYYKANGDVFPPQVILYPKTLLNFQPGDSKTQPVMIPPPYVTPPADIDGGKAIVDLYVFKPPYGLGDVILALSQQNPVSHIIYDIGLTW